MIVTGKTAATGSDPTPHHMLPVLPGAKRELPTVQLQELNKAIKCVMTL